MRELRVYEGEQLIFDARKEVLDFRGKKGLALIKMAKGPLSYTTADGTTFRKNHPFNWVTEGEASFLLGINEYDSSLEFKPANKEQVEDYYSF